MSSRSPVLRGVRAAFVFLTRLPVGGFPYSADDWKWAPTHFPLVGLVVGAACAASYWAACSLDRSLAALAALITSVLLTGALHEDGLADTADALWGTRDRARLFEILKDSRVGTYGVLALVIGVLLRFLALVALLEHALVALVVTHVMARWGPVWLLACLPYVTANHAKSRAVTHAGPRQAWGATLWVSGLALTGFLLDWLSWQTLGGCLLSVAVATVGSGVWFRRRASGITGDFLGATEQLCEALVLLALLTSARAGVF